MSVLLTRHVVAMLSAEILKVLFYAYVMKDLMVMDLTAQVRIKGIVLNSQAPKHVY